MLSESKERVISIEKFLEQNGHGLGLIGVIKLEEGQKFMDICKGYLKDEIEAQSPGIQWELKKTGENEVCIGHKGKGLSSYVLKQHMVYTHA